MRMVITEKIKKILFPQLFLRGFSITFHGSKVGRGMPALVCQGVPVLTGSVIQKREPHFQVIQAGYNHFHLREVFPKSAQTYLGRNLPPRSECERLGI